MEREVRGLEIFRARGDQLDGGSSVDHGNIRSRLQLGVDGGSNSQCGHKGDLEREERERKEAAETLRSAAEMERDCRREPEGESDRHPERERQKEEEERALELEQERHDRQREEKRDEAPCAEIIVPSSCPAPSTSNPAAISSSNVKKDRCIVLDNVFDGTVERENKFYLGVRNHLLRNSARCGPVNHIHVDRKRGRVYMLFDCARSANKGADKWHQSSYQGNVITVSFEDTAKYKEEHGAEG